MKNLLAISAIIMLSITAAHAADDFGQPFANEAPSALSDAPYTEEQIAESPIEAPWDIEPAAGAETLEGSDPSDTTFDLPASDESIIMNKDAPIPSDAADDIGP